MIRDACGIIRNTTSLVPYSCFSIQLSIVKNPGQTIFVAETDKYRVTIEYIGDKFYEGVCKIWPDESHKINEESKIVSMVNELTDKDLTNLLLKLESSDIETLL
jgi:hypothetical protein